MSRSLLVVTCIALALTVVGCGQAAPATSTSAAATTAQVSPTSPTAAAPAPATTSPSSTGATPSSAPTASSPGATAEPSLAPPASSPAATGTSPPVPTGTPPSAAAGTASSAAATRQVGSVGGDPAAPYLDDRTTAEAVVRSYFSAINRKEYARAYGYWESGAAPAQLPPFEQFRRGYEQTAAVQLATGRVRSDAGAGQLYFAVPVSLVARTTAGATETFVGCYTLHLAQPAIQAEPPYRPMAISSAAIRTVPNDARTADLMGSSCADGSP
jgi:hypothetical protein